MADKTPNTPVGDTVSKVGDEIAVGEDLEFQRRWWKFENAVWIFFVLLLLADVLGLFGRGWLAKARTSTPDGALVLDYEHIERASTPSIMTLTFGPEAIHEGKIQLAVSDSLLKPLGAQRIAPQPALSALAAGGIVYTFEATGAPTSVQIALEPSFPGAHDFHMGVLGPGGVEELHGNIIVVP